MVDRTGNSVGESSSSAQIRTLFDEQRQWSSQNAARKFLITNSKQLEPKKNVEFYKKNYGVSKKDSRLVHQQSVTEMEELRKSQSSTFDTIAWRKFIEDQKTILELSGRVQELQNEVNCMNDWFQGFSGCWVDL